LDVSGQRPRQLVDELDDVRVLVPVHAFPAPRAQLAGGRLVTVAVALDVRRDPSFTGVSVML
jgi:hypothetical protein